MIKKRIVLLAIFSVLYSADRNSQIFFMPRGTTESPVIEFALQGYKMYHNNYSAAQKPYDKPDKRALLNIQNNYFYQESDHTSSLGKYFLPVDSSQVSVSQAGGDGTIGSKWLGLERSDGTFKSNLSLSPKRTAYGTVINYHQDLSAFSEGLWLGFMLPIMKVEHKLDLAESLMSAEGEDDSKNVLEALNQADFKFGKFSTKTISKVGFDDMQLKLGVNAIHDDEVRVGLYLDALISLHGQPNSEFVFGHVLGNGGHDGLGIGLNYEFLLNEYGSHRLSLIGDVRYRYLLPGTENRSFDLSKNGPWSRYLLVVREGDATTPLAGINFFTREVTVQPRDTAEVFTALHYNRSDFNLEIGYNFWWRNTEKITLKNTFNENIGIFSPFALTPGGGTASTAKISENFGDVTADANNQFVKITQRDFNLHSAAHKTAVSHTFFAGVSIDTIFLDSPWMVGAGASYENARDNAAVDNWSGWVKTCLSF